MNKETKLLRELRKAGWTVKFAWLSDKAFGECHYERKEIVINLLTCISSVFIHELFHWEKRNANLDRKVEEDKALAYEVARMKQLTARQVVKLAEAIYKEVENGKGKVLPVSRKRQ